MKNRIGKVAFHIFMLAALLAICSCVASSVYAEETSSISSAYLDEKLEQANTDELLDRLPQETRETLEEIGAASVDTRQISTVSFQDIWNSIGEAFSIHIPTVLHSFLGILAVILLCALLNSMKLSLGEQPVGDVIHLVGMLCVVSIVLSPILSCIQKASEVIQGGTYFLIGCIPLLITLLIAGGKMAASGSLGTIILSLCNGISLLAAQFLVPILNIFLGFSIVSVISPSINLNGICKCFYSSMKWVLGFGMTIFSALLTMQGLLGDATNVATNKTVKFVVSSFVPIVGNALGEAFGTVHSCAKLICSGVGAFGMLAILFLFLPIFIQCILWSITLTLAAGISDVFDLKAIGSLIRSIAKVISMLIAILLCCVVLLTISLGILMIMGGNIS